MTCTAGMMDRDTRLDPCMPELMPLDEHNETLRVRQAHGMAAIDPVPPIGQSFSSSGIGTHSRSALLSVIVPTLNEEVLLPRTLASAARADAEVIVVDGGSTDRTVPIADRMGARVIESPPGRARQMNAGAAEAAGELLLFLHADTLLPAGYQADVRRVLDDPAVAGGAFRLRIAGSRSAFRVIERAVNLRSRCLSLPYGDQAIFMRRDSLIAAGGFPSIPVLEDFVLVRRLRRRGEIRLARSAVLTSARRWDHHGPWRTTARNQLAIAAFLLGVSPHRIARLLGREPPAVHTEGPARLASPSARSETFALFPSDRQTDLAQAVRS